MEVYNAHSTFGGLVSSVRLHLGTPRHPQGRVFSHGYLSAPPSPAAGTGTSSQARASRRPVRRPPRKGPLVFSSLVAPSLALGPHACVCNVSQRTLCKWICVRSCSSRRQTANNWSYIHTYIHMYIGLHPSSHFPGRRVACGEDVRLLFITVGPSTKGVC